MDVVRPRPHPVQRRYLGTATCEESGLHSDCLPIPRPCSRAMLGAKRDGFCEQRACGMVAHHRFARLLPTQGYRIVRRA